MADSLRAFEAHRALLFGIAYRMTGSVMDAEDLVQEAYLRWSRIHGDTVRSPRDYLVTIITRLAIDYLGSARVRREEYVGPWLPEPIVMAYGPDPAGNPEDKTELVESLQMAFLVVLENLSPPERAAFLLHDVFGYGYTDLARILDKSEDNCRQLVHRARERVTKGRPRFESSPGQLEEVTRRFVESCATGNIGALLAMLAPDVVLTGDGGGNIANARRPVYGRMNVARLMLGLALKAPRGLEGAIKYVNAQPGVVLWLGERPYAVLTLAVADGRIRAVYIVNNPDKLRCLTALATS